MEKINNFFIVFLSFTFVLSDCSLKNPFSFNQISKVSPLASNNDLNKKEIVPSVQAISVFKKKFGAIIKINTDLATIFQGDIVLGYKILEITKDQVILVKKNKSTILKLNI